MPTLNVTCPQFYSPEALMYLPQRRDTEKKEEKQYVPSAINVLLSKFHLFVIHILLRIGFSDFWFCCIEMELTPEGSPMFRPNEVEVYRDENISLYDHSRKTDHQDGWCCVTTHRIIYVDHISSPPKAFYLPLAAVAHVSKEKKFLTRSGMNTTKLFFFFFLNDLERILIISISIANLRIDFNVEDVFCNNKMYIKLSFKQGGRDEFFDPLMAALDRRAWQDIRGICKQPRALSS
jgi:hypothetical protein